MLPRFVFLLAVAVVAMLSKWAAQRQAAEELTLCCQNLRGYGAALEAYSTDNVGRYPSTSKALVPGYLTSLPTCPTSGFAYRCATASNPDLYTIVCQGRHHPGWSPLMVFPGGREPVCRHGIGDFVGPAYVSTTGCWGCLGKP